MASYDKIVKYVVDNFHSAVSPLQDVTKNQEIIIVQNKQIIALLEKIRIGGLTGEVVDVTTLPREEDPQ